MNYEELCEKLVSVLSRILTDDETYYEIDDKLRSEAAELIERWRHND